MSEPAPFPLTTSPQRFTTVDQVINHWRQGGDEPQRMSTQARHFATRLTDAKVSTGGSFLIGRVDKTWYVLHCGTAKAMDGADRLDRLRSDGHGLARTTAYEAASIHGEPIDWHSPGLSDRMARDPAIATAIGEARRIGDVRHLIAEERKGKAPTQTAGRFADTAALREYYLAGGDDSLPESHREWMRTQAPLQEFRLTPDGGFALIPPAKRGGLYALVPAGCGWSIGGDRAPFAATLKKSDALALAKYFAAHILDQEHQPVDWSRIDLSTEMADWESNQGESLPIAIVRTRAAFDVDHGLSDSPAIRYYSAVPGACSPAVQKSTLGTL